MKSDDGGNAGNLSINGIDSYPKDSKRKKGLCRPFTDKSKVAILKYALSDSDLRPSSIVVIDRETGETPFAPYGVYGNTHAVFSGIKFTGVAKDKKQSVGAPKYFRSLNPSLSMRELISLDRAHRSAPNFHSRDYDKTSL